MRVYRKDLPDELVEKLLVCVDGVVQGLVASFDVEEGEVHAVPADILADPMYYHTLLEDDVPTEVVRGEVSLKLLSAVDPQITSDFPWVADIELV